MMRSTKSSCLIPSYGRKEAELVVTQTGKKKEDTDKDKMDERWREWNGKFYYGYRLLT
jgi:hypothetical protein